MRTLVCLNKCRNKLVKGGDVSVFNTQQVVFNHLHFFVLLAIKVHQLFFCSIFVGDWVIGKD